MEERGGGGGEGARGREGGPVCDGSAYTALLICPLIGSKEHHQVAQSRDNRTQTGAREGRDVSHDASRLFISFVRD